MLNLDRDQFKQVMINLLDNAIHALNGEERKIEIRLIYNEVLKMSCWNAQTPATDFLRRISCAF
jgi:nitrogen-specific signal transduction histidine kinase